MSNLNPDQFGIQVTDTSTKEFPGVTLHRGRVADGQFGYRGVGSLDELRPVDGPGMNPTHGYRSRGSRSVGPEKHSRGVTMFAAAPLDSETMQRQGYTHQLKVDLSGLPFRTLREPKDGVVHADMGLGLGVVGEMKHERIHEVRDHTGKPLPVEFPHATYGSQVEEQHFEDTGRRPRGR